jgi:hypothetical protein
MLPTAMVVVTDPMYSRAPGRRCANHQAIVAALSRATFAGLLTAVDVTLRVLFPLAFILAH